MFALSLLAIVGWAGSVFASDPVSSDFTASVNILQTITITENTAMDFGIMIKPSADGAPHNKSTGDPGASAGVFGITGSPGVSSSSSVGQCSTGLTLTLGDDVDSGSQLIVNGSLRVTSAASASSPEDANGEGEVINSCSYTVSANYSSS